MARNLRARCHCYCKVLVLALALSLFAAGYASAVPPKYFELSSPSISASTGAIIAKVSISVDNLRGLFDMLKDGATLELRINAAFERVRTLWTNVTIYEKEYVYILRHNPLTREFAMFVPNEPQPLLDKNLNRLLFATWSKFQVDFGPPSLLENPGSDTEYKALLAITLQHVDVPPWLAKNFVLWSKNVVAPETVTLPFRH